MSTDPNSSRRNTIALGLVVTAVVVVIAGWLLSPGPVKLSPQTYPVTVALYRACNQQDTESLAKIEAELEALQTATTPEDDALAHLQDIVETARAGQWKVAMQQSRQALQDQTASP